MNNAFFAMDTAFYHRQGRYRPTARAEMLAELGYAGTCATLWDQRAWDDLPALLEALDKHGLTLFSIYVPHDVHTGELDERLADALPLLAGRPTLIELPLTSSGNHDKPSASRADGRGAAMIRKVAAAAQPHGVRVSLYPHRSFWMERAEDAVRLLMRINDPAIGLTFNLIHWLLADGKNLEDRLQLAAPRMLNATINGATFKGPGDVSIEPLDTGSVDTFHYLCLLQKLGYAGPVGLQAFSVGGDVYANLRRSMQAWQDLRKRVVRHARWGELDPTVAFMA